MPDFDRSQLDQLERDLAAAPAEVRPQLGKVIDKGAKAIARTARQMIEGSTRGIFLPHYPKSITSEMTGEMQAEVGPVTSRKQGGMGPGVEFGSINHGPLPHLFPAAEQEIPKVSDEVLAVAAQATL